MDLQKPKLLDYFEPHYRGPIINLILEQLRMGKTSETDILNGIFAIYQNRKKWGNPGETLNKFYDFYLKEQDFSKLFSEAINYYRNWENLPKDEKEKIKQASSDFFRKSFMATKPPTEKQIAFLKKYNKQIPNNRLEASELIDQIINTN